METQAFDDWVHAPNIANNVVVYELENQALAADGRLDEALRAVRDWSGEVLLDVGCGTGFWLPPYATDAAGVVGVEPDDAHARFAYFFGEGGDRGLAEVARALRPGGVLAVVDNDWGYGEFAELLRDATGGNADIDPDVVDRSLEQHPDQHAITYGFAVFVWQPPDGT